MGRSKSRHRRESSKTQRWIDYETQRGHNQKAEDRKNENGGKTYEE